MPAPDGLVAAAARAPDPYAAARDPDATTVAPDGRAAAAQPSWRRDFPIDSPEDEFVARRDFAKFLVLTSGAFTVGQAWIAALSLNRANRTPPPRRRVASLADLAPGTATEFHYPTEDDPCLLLRFEDGAVAAFSQKCTHLSCAVIPRLDEGLLHCPCHEGFFDARTGVNLAGPPPRPLPEIELEIDGDGVFAVGVTARMS